MKKLLKSSYHFLGSIYLAVFLIATSALMVIFGTFLESKTESHLFAAHYIYQSFFFKLLLVGYFLNILISALRRWPFRKRHIPFLITHFGLLMIIGGTFVKTVMGAQGNLLLREGTASDLLLIPESQALNIETKNPKAKYNFPLADLHKTELFKVVNLEPNAREKLTSWIHGDQAVIDTIPTFKALPWKAGDAIPNEKILALLTDEDLAAKTTLYQERAKLNFSDSITGKKFAERVLKDVASPLQVGNFQITATLDLQNLHVQYSSLNSSGVIQIPLVGPDALINKNASAPLLGQAPFVVDLTCMPTMLLLQDSQKNSQLFTIDPWGRIYQESFQEIKSYIAYEEGFQGYALQAEIPRFKENRTDLEKKVRKILVEELKSSQIPLSPPIEFFKRAVGTNFAEEFVAFLESWNRRGSWLYPSNGDASKIVEKMDLAKMDPAILKACLWCCNFFSEFDSALAKDVDFINLLEDRGWPLVAPLRKNPELAPLLFTQQIFEVRDSLPFPQETLKDKARIFSAYLRAYDIHLSSIPFEYNPEVTKFICESPLRPTFEPLPASQKWEDNAPQVSLEVGEQKELIKLGYDRTGSGMCWPALNGNLLLRFQPQVFKLPYKVRLHRAKQINFPQSNQPYSYECVLTLQDKRTRELIQKTLSMNEVLETSDGYRFYLSGISTNPTGIHAVQIVVNRDPVRYWLTYPGAAILALGILLLFWSKSFR